VARKMVTEIREDNFTRWLDTCVLKTFWYII